ncbi:MAG: hypothetical protein ACLQUT_11360 [Thermoleophilia bacterium]
MTTTDTSASEPYPAELARLILPRAGMTVRELHHLLFEIREEDQDKPMTQDVLAAEVERENAFYTQFGA